MHRPSPVLVAAPEVSTVRQSPFNTRVEAKATALFGEWVNEPGIWKLPPDNEGWVWVLVVSDTRRILSLSTVPNDLLDEPLEDKYFQWRDQCSARPRLALIT